MVSREILVVAVDEHVIEQQAIRGRCMVSDKPQRCVAANAIGSHPRHVLIGNGQCREKTGSRAALAIIVPAQVSAGRNE